MIIIIINWKAVSIDTAIALDYSSRGECIMENIHLTVKSPEMKDIKDYVHKHTYNITDNKNVFVNLIIIYKLAIKCDKKYGKTNKEIFDLGIMRNSTYYDMIKKNMRHRFTLNDTALENISKAFVLFKDGMEEYFGENCKSGKIIPLDSEIDDEWSGYFNELRSDYKTNIKRLDAEIDKVIKKFENGTLNKSTLLYRICHYWIKDVSYGTGEKISCIFNELDKIRFDDWIKECRVDEKAITPYIEILKTQLDYATTAQHFAELRNGKQSEH